MASTTGQQTSQLLVSGIERIRLPALYHALSGLPVSVSAVIISQEGAPRLAEVYVNAGEDHGEAWFRTVEVGLKYGKAVHRKGPKEEESFGHMTVMLQVGFGSSGGPGSFSYKSCAEVVEYVKQKLAQCGFGPPPSFLYSDSRRSLSTCLGAIFFKLQSIQAALAVANPSRPLFNEVFTLSTGDTISLHSFQLGKKTKIYMCNPNKGRRHVICVTVGR